MRPIRSYLDIRPRNGDQRGHPYLLLGRLRQRTSEDQLQLLILFLSYYIDSSYGVVNMVAFYRCNMPQDRQYTAYFYRCSSRVLSRSYSPLVLATHYVNRAPSCTGALSNRGEFSPLDYCVSYFYTCKDHWFVPPSFSVSYFYTCRIVSFFDRWGRDLAPS
jgi:hypothetical protein